MVNADAYKYIGEKMKTRCVDINGLNCLVLNCLNIKIDTNKYSKNEMETLLKEREGSLLNLTELKNKIEMDEVFCLNNGNGVNKLYVYIAPNGCEMSKVQFYDDNGILFTYPWNGKYNIESVLDKTSGKFKAAYEMTTDRFTSFCYWKGRKEIKHLQCGLTKSGRIAIDDFSLVKKMNKESSEWNLSVFNNEGKEQIVVDPKLYGVKTENKTLKNSKVFKEPLIAK